MTSSSAATSRGAATLLASGMKISAEPKPEKPRAVPDTKAIAQIASAMLVEMSEGIRLKEVMREAGSEVRIAVRRARPHYGSNVTALLSDRHPRAKASPLSLEVRAERAPKDESATAGPSTLRDGRYAASSG
ncbi:hypothetical protein BE61_08520 [Bradyrhizobium elkanii USDA 61]|nr:hypothetical protein BE61_08520 [Bradyrhizobium elkanii USDA 61]